MAYYNENGYHPSRTSSHHSNQQHHQVEFSEPPPRTDKYKQSDSSKSTTRVALLLFLGFFLAGAASFAAVSTALTPWWIQNGGATNYEWVRIGLWKACIKETVNSDWQCKDYNDGTSDSPFGDMELLQNCMIAAAGVSGLSFVFTLLAFVIRKSKMFKAFIATILCLTLAAAILYGISIGYASDEKEAKKLVPKWLLGVGGELKHALMFYLACAGAGCAFVALVVSAVFIFITDDDQQEEEHSDKQDGKEERRKGFYKNRPSSWNDGYDKSIDFEREISRRGRNVLNNHRHPFDYAVQNEVDDGKRYYDEKPVEKQIYPEYQQRQSERRVPIERRTSYDDRGRHNSQEENYRGNRRSFNSNNPDYPIDNTSEYATDQRQSYQSYQPALINRPPVHPPSYEHDNKRLDSSASLPDYKFQPPRRYEYEAQQPKLISVQQRRNSAPLEHPRSSRKSSKHHSSEQPNYNDYEMYFNTPY